MPPKRGRGRAQTPGTDPNLLWINRTPDSSTLSATRHEREEVRTITNHARQWRAALRRQQRLQNAQTEATNAQSVVGWEQPGNLYEFSSAETSPVSTPIAMVQTAGSDERAFDFLETPDDAWWSREAFQFATESWLPSIFRDLDMLDTSVAESDATSTTSSHLIRGGRVYRMHLYCMLAASSAFSKYILGIPPNRHDAPEYCMGKALQHLRHHLEGEPMPGRCLIFDMLALAAAERYVGNYEGAKTHLHMVHQLVQARRESDPLSLPMRMLCYLSDLQIAARLGESPLFRLDWDPGPIDRVQMEEQVLPALHQGGINPGGSSLVSLCRILSSEMSIVLEDTIQWFQVQQYNHLVDFTDTSTSHWATKRSLALVHRLLSNPRTTTRSLSLDHWQIHLSSAIKYSILLILSDTEMSRRHRIASAENDPPREPTAPPWSDPSRLRKVLSRLLETEQEWQSDDYEKLILWLACIGIQATANLANRRQPSQMTPSTIAEEAEMREHYAWFLALARQYLARGRDGLPADVLPRLLSLYLHFLDVDGRPSMTGLEELLP